MAQIIITECSDVLCVKATGEGTIAEALAMWRRIAAQINVLPLRHILFENHLAPPRQPETTMIGYDFALEFLNTSWKPGVIIAVVCTPERYDDMKFTLEVIMNRSPLEGRVFTDLVAAKRWLNLIDS
jgi:hypothetical protein